MLMSPFLSLSTNIPMVNLKLNTQLDCAERNVSDSSSAAARRSPKSIGISIGLSKAVDLYSVRGKLLSASV